MSKDSLKSLLDEMLDDASHQFAAQERTPAPPPPSNTFTDVEQLRALGDVELRKVLALASRDDLLTVLAGGSDGLRRKVLTNLSAESVRWLQQNLEYFDEPTRALLESGRKRLITLANRLLGEGAIALPKPAGEGAEEAATPDELEQLCGVITELLGLVQKRGPGALRDVASAGGDPMLDEGLAMVVRGADERVLSEGLDAMKLLMLKAYARRLDVIREGVLALRRGEDPESFRKRFEEIGKQRGA